MNSRIVIGVVGVIVVLWAVAGFAQPGPQEEVVALRSLEPPVYLPDGTEFKTWEAPLRFSKTHYVDQSHPEASNSNPGTKEKPLRTINRAAQVLEPGERVIVRAGTYREWVRPARGGTGPGRMISYEAAPGQKVVIKGSRILKTRWVRSKRPGKPQSRSVWMAELPEEYFDGYNPFAIENVTDEQFSFMPWAQRMGGKPPYILPRGLIFQNGRRLKQVARYEDLPREVGTYWVEPGGKAVHIHPFGDGDPNAGTSEITTQKHVFAPEPFGLGYIRVKGFTIEHVGNGFPMPQEGAISTRRGHHWIIEDNVVRQVNGVGIDIGRQGASADRRAPPLVEGGVHIVRRNTITECGISGIQGLGVAHTLIERNTIRRCGWHNVEGYYETGGIKLHLTRGTLIRKNIIQYLVGAPGIWMDYGNVNSRCTQNVVIGVQSIHGAIFMEASQKPNLVDHNFVWDTQGVGIYQHDCDEQIFAHNFVARSTKEAVKMRVNKGRRVGGRFATAKRNKVLNNIFVANGSMISFSDPDNVSDFNVFDGDKKFDLAAWQKARPWDEHSVNVEINATFNPGTMELTWSAGRPVPDFPRIRACTHDFWDQPREGGKVSAGPFGVIPTTPVTIKVWPR